MFRRNIINVSLLVEGNKAQWDQFVRRFLPIIHSIVLKITSSSTHPIPQEDREEIVQEVFLKLIKNDYACLRKYEETRASLVTWITIIAKSTTIDLLRKKKLLTVPLKDYHESKEVCQETPISNLGIPSDLLSSRQMLVLQLWYDKGMPPNEIAETLGINITTVYTCKHKAINKLRTFFEKEIN